MRSPSFRGSHAFRSNAESCSSWNDARTAFDVYMYAPRVAVPNVKSCSDTCVFSDSSAPMFAVSLFVAHWIGAPSAVVMTSATARIPPYAFIVSTSRAWNSTGTV
jgi:hypothetical protein